MRHRVVAAFTCLLVITGQLAGVGGATQHDSHELSEAIDSSAAERGIDSGVSAEMQLQRADESGVTSATRGTEATAGTHSRQRLDAGRDDASRLRLEASSNRSDSVVKSIDDVYKGINVGASFNPQTDPPYTSHTVGDYTVKVVEVSSKYVALDVYENGQLIVDNKYVEEGNEVFFDGDEVSIFLKSASKFSSDSAAVFFYFTVKTSTSEVSLQPEHLDVTQGTSEQFTLSYPSFDGGSGVCDPTAYVDGEAAKWITDDSSWIEDISSVYGGDYREIEADCDAGEDGSVQIDVSVPKDTDTGMRTFDLIVNTGKDTVYRLTDIEVDVTEANEAPTEPTTNTPSDGASNVKTDVTLDWSASDPDGDSLTYTLYLEKGDSNPDQVATDLSSSSYTAQLDSGATYYWQVAVTDSNGKTTTGPVWSFTTATAPPTLSDHSLQSSPTAGESVQFQASLSDPDGDSVSVTLEVYDPSDGRWEQATTKQTSDGTLSWSPTPFEDDDEGSAVKYRLVYDDGAGHSGTWGPFTGPEIGDDDTSGPTIVSVESPDSVVPDGAIDVSVDVSDANSGVSSVTVSYTYPDGETGTVQLSRADGQWTGTIPGVATAGDVTFTVTATDGDNTPAKTESGTRTVTVVNEAPNVELTANRTTVPEGGDVLLDGTGTTDPNGDSLRYFWDQIGTPSVIPNDGTASAVVTVPEVNRNRSVTVELIVRDGNGAEVTGSVRLKLVDTDTAPTVDLSGPSTVTAGETATFDASGSTDTDGDTLSFNWDFDGDGQTDATGATVDHRFPEAGTYQVTVTVRDEDGQTATEQLNVTVEREFDEKHVFEFQNGVEGWTFGKRSAPRSSPGEGRWSSQYDGSIRLSVNGAPSTIQTWQTVGPLSAGTKIKVNYAPERFEYAAAGVKLYLVVPGERRIQLDADNDNSGGDFEQNGTLVGTVPEDLPADTQVEVRLVIWPGETTVWIQNVTILGESVDAAPTANLSVSTTTSTVGETVTFDASGSSDPDGDSISYRWDFDGDGTVDETTVSPTTTHTYESTGTYQATLTVVANGKTDTVTRTITVEQKPTLNATREIPSQVFAGEIVTITVRVPLDESVSGLAIDEEIDTLDVVNQTTSPTAEFKRSELQWLFLSADGTAVVKYTLQIPEDAEPGTTYEISGTVSASNYAGVPIGGDTTVTVRQCVAVAVSGPDRRIGLRDIQQAIDDWSDGESVAGQQIDLRQIQRLIDMWAEETPAQCGGN